MTVICSAVTIAHAFVGCFAGAAIGTVRNSAGASVTGGSDLEHPAKDASTEHEKARNEMRSVGMEFS
jgi:hypothetical protein